MRARLFSVALFVTTLFLMLACAFADDRKSIVPPYELIKTSNGVSVYFFPSPNVPLFEVKLVFQGGSDLDPPGKSGLSMFASAMIRRGIPGMDEDALSRKLDDIAGGVDVGVGEELFTVAGYGLNAKADEIIDLFFRQLTEPTFPEAPFKRLKANHLDSIIQLPDSPGGLAGHVLDSVIFNGTIKARSGSGLKRDVERITLEDAKKFFPTMLRTDRLIALVIGGESRKDIADKVVRGIEKLPCPNCGQPVPQPKRWDFKSWKVPPGHVLLVPRPGIPEAYVKMGFIGPKRKVPEFYDLRVAETILSGTFASRLNQVIREKLNLTYNISAGFYFGNTTGSFLVSTTTRNEKIVELLTQTRKLLDEFVRGDVRDPDLKIAKDYILGSFPLGLQNLYVTANTYFNGVLSELEPDFMDAFSGRIGGVSLESMGAATRKHLKLGEMMTVVVGDPKELKPLLEKAKIKYVVKDAKLFL